MVTFKIIISGPVLELEKTVSEKEIEKELNKLKRLYKTGLDTFKKPVKHKYIIAKQLPENFPKTTIKIEKI